MHLNCYHFYSPKNYLYSKLVKGLQGYGLGYGFAFNGKEKDNEVNGEGNAYDFGARIHDPRLGRWLSLDPFQAKYPDLTPYNFVGNMPIIAIDPDGRDIIFLSDKEAAGGAGHCAVLIGNPTSGWIYVSMNGTGDGSKPWGISKNPDLRTEIRDENNKIISDYALAIKRANVINPEENNHSYDASQRITTTPLEDEMALKAASKSAANKVYGIIGPGKSCIDVGQAAFGAIVESRMAKSNADVPGEGAVIPNLWFKNLSDRVIDANKMINDPTKEIKFNTMPAKSTIKFTPPPISDDNYAEPPPSE